MWPVKSLPNLDSEYFVSVSNELVYIVPPTSICTGAEYFDAAATHGMPDMTCGIKDYGNHYDVIGFFYLMTGSDPFRILCMITATNAERR